MPLRDSDNTIIGVVTLINKRFGCFTNNDEDFVEAFGVFAGHSLENVSKLDQVKQAEARCQVTLDIMAYHASSSVADAEKLSELETPSSLQLRLMTFSFTDQEMEDNDTLRASLRMFKDLGLVRKFKLEHKTLCRWLLTVKKNYRPEVAYHNWRHAFQVAQVRSSLLSTFLNRFPNWPTHLLLTFMAIGEPDYYIPCILDVQFHFILTGDVQLPLQQ